MALFFFKSDDSLEDFSQKIFNALGISTYLEGDSAHVMGGYYYCYSVFGIQIKVELNSYGYENEYQFMLSVRKDFVSKLQTDESFEQKVAEIVIVLLKGLQIEFAEEKGDSLIRIN